MSKRAIPRDVGEARLAEYRELENTGQSQKALWATIQYLLDQGIDVGPAAHKQLAERNRVKKAAPK
jgi:hypothetical protein